LDLRWKHGGHYRGAPTGATETTTSEGVTKEAGTIL
jgi:hypothetical protein